MQDSLHRIVIESILDQIETSIDNSGNRGTIQNHIISALTDPKTGEPIANYASVKLKLDESLQDMVSNESNGLRVLV